MAQQNGNNLRWWSYFADTLGLPRHVGWLVRKGSQVFCSVELGKDNVSREKQPTFKMCTEKGQDTARVKHMQDWNVRLPSDLGCMQYLLSATSSKICDQATGKLVAEIIETWTLLLALFAFFNQHLAPLYEVAPYASAMALGASTLPNQHVVHD